jgi:hypothetical protein
MTLYKYIDHWGLSIITENRIKLTEPDEFNDPFEVLPKMINPSKQMVVEKLNDPEFQKILHTMSPAIGNMDTTQRVELLYQFYSKDQYTAENFRDVAKKYFSVTCFTTKPDNLLMWAHYADHHKGMVIGFNSESNHSFGKFVHPVDYNPKRIEYSIATANIKSNEAIIPILRRKSPEWAYEEEHRLLVPHRSDEIEVEKGMRFYKIVPSDIVQVIFGCKIEPQLKKSTLDALQESHQHVTIHQAACEDDSYSLAITPPL